MACRRPALTYQFPMHQSHVAETRCGDGEAKLQRQRFKIKTAGESGRTGIQPFHFFRIAFRSSSNVSSVANTLWPVVPAAIAVRYALPDNHLTISKSPKLQSLDPSSLRCYYTSVFVLLLEG